MFHKHLIRKINSGRCLALVGSGLSCEIGYPSWHALADQAYRQLKESEVSIDDASYRKYLANKNYPELFRQIERDLGDDRQSLVDFLKPILLPSEKKRGMLYDLITRWPFACYLTTNFDDEISVALTASGQHFSVVYNKRDDFHVWRDGISHIIQKLHSDLEHPNDAVITSEDYRRLQSDPAGQYFRDRLSSIFTIFDILVVGHSLTDPDINYILQLAKTNASPHHPIYFVSSDFTRAEETELFEQYNVVLIQYEVINGQHSQLLQLLRAADRFIVPRSRRSDLASLPVSSTDDLEKAIAIFLFRKLQGSQPADYLATIILSALATHSVGEVPLTSIATLPSLKNLTTRWSKDSDAIVESLDYLQKEELVTLENSVANITNAGRSKYEELHTLRETERSQAFGQFELTLRTLNPDIDDSTLLECTRSAETVIAESFTQRGAAIANTVFADRARRPEELSDIFALVSDYAARFTKLSTRVAFVEAIHKFIVEPNRPQRDYLASVSQGFFLYHALGLDPKCGDVRNEIFRNTLWLCDSSVLLPLVAFGCHNNDYAISLFRMLAERDALVCTTSRLLQEVWEHFQWAVRFVERNSFDSLEYLRAALVQGNYKQNLFLDGYIRLSAEGQIGTFQEYVSLIVPSPEQGQVSFEKKIRERGIQIVSLPDFPGMVDEDWAEFEEAKLDIEGVRRDRGTYRAPLQVESEAEIMIVLKNLRSKKYLMNGLGNLEHFYFVSQSQIIDIVSQETEITTWSPEAVYRYISALSGNNTDPQLLQQCMLHEYYYAGISFVDRARYEHFFGPSINSANTSYKKERASYVADVERTALEDMDNAFKLTDELEKPFFVAQMGWSRARAASKREEAALHRAREAEDRVKALVLERDHAWKVREARTKEQEERTDRNAQDPKHVNKRLRQAKKRRRQKKK